MEFSDWTMSKTIDGKYRFASVTITARLGWWLAAGFNPDYKKIFDDHIKTGFTRDDFDVDGMMNWGVKVEGQYMPYRYTDYVLLSIDSLNFAFQDYTKGRCRAYENMILLINPTYKYTESLMMNKEFAQKLISMSYQPSAGNWHEFRELADYLSDRMHEFED